MDKSLLTLICIIFLTFSINAQITNFGADGHVIIGEGLSGFFAGLEGGDRFSRDHDVIGDVNGDGILDLVIGARSDDDGFTDAGAVYILFMNNDGTVQSNQKISMTEGGFNGDLSNNAFFGYGVAGIGDYDGDNIPDIAVSRIAPADNSLYIIHLNSDGTVKDFVKNNNVTAQGLTAIGDINGDGKIDLVACNPRSNDGGTSRGAIDILFFNASSQIIRNNTVTISSTQGGFGGSLNDNEQFGGREVAMLGDINGDGTKELAVGAFLSDGGKGAIWILSLDQNTFEVVSEQKITEGSGGFTDVLTLEENPNGTAGAQFGHSMCAPGDLNGDGIPDLITGANQQDNGVAYILYLNADKTVKTFNRINGTEGGFDISLATDERFSRSISCVGDIRGDGTIAVNFGGGAGGTGTLYMLFFKPCDFSLTPGNNFYEGGNTLFSNWTHSTQTVDGPLSLEQCTFKAFETGAPFMTFNPADGRCICKDETATLAFSTEQSSAYSNQCIGGTDAPYLTGNTGNELCTIPWMDSDGDGICDVADICEGGDDFADSDNDGIPDACDNGSNSGGDPFLTGNNGNEDCVGPWIDSDGDGICDAADICEGGDDFADSDNDGIPDACDDGSNSGGNPFLTGNNGSEDCVGPWIDSDGDGICDAADICEGGDDFMDSDDDGIPDACDDGSNSGGNPFLTGNTGNELCPVPWMDSDGDGVCNAADTCEGGDDFMDSNGNGIPDACDDGNGTTNPNYCTSVGLNTTYEYIESVVFGNLNNASGNNGGFGDFTNLSASVVRGSSVAVTLTPGLPEGDYSEHWKIWIDYNQDGDFTDAGERVFLGSAYAAATTGTVSIPTSASLGSTRMRISMRWNADMTPCTDLAYGEVEDYTVIISASINEVNIAQRISEPIASMSIYPNPVNDFLHIETQNIATNSLIEIYDNMGRLIDTQKVVEEEINMTVDVNDLPKGIFLVVLKSKDRKVFTERFVK